MAIGTTNSNGGATALISSVGLIANTEKAAPNGVATLDGNSKVMPIQASSKIFNINSNIVLALEHASGFITMNGDAAQTVTVPPETSVAFPISTEIEICQLNTGTVTFVADTGVTILSVDSSMAISDQYGCACLKKISADTWLLAGALG